MDEPASAPLALAPSGRAWRRLRWSWGWLLSLAVIAAYAAAAWVVLLPFGLVEATRMPVSAAQDVGQQVWWLALEHHDIVHGDWSFFTTAIDHPAGVNLLDNGSMPLLGLIMSPATAAAGPVGAYMLLLRIGHFVSACAAYWVVRRLGFGRLGAAAAGLIYAFGPAMGPPTAQHAFLVFAPLPPLVLYLIYRALVPRGERARPFLNGLLVGVLVAAQYLISPELLLSTLLMAAVVAIVAALWCLITLRPTRFPPTRAVRVVLGTVLTGAPLLAYPVHAMLTGPGHVEGPVQLAQPGIPLVSIVLPTSTVGAKSGGQILAALQHGWRDGHGIWPSGNMGYLGPLALAAAITAVFCVRDLRVRLVTVFALLAVVLELGPRIQLPTRTLSLELPFHWLYRVPLLQDIEPTRVPILLGLMIGILVAAGLDRCVAAVTRRRSSWIRRGLATVAAGVGVALVGAGLASAAPATALSVYGVAPSRATSEAIGRHIPTGAVVLALPYPSFNHESAMLLQAQSGVHFDLLGGYAVRPHGPRHHATKVPLLHAPAPLSNLIDGHPVSSQLAQIAADEFMPWLRFHHVTELLIQQTNVASVTLTGLADQRFGQPLVIDGWVLWHV